MLYSLFEYFRFYFDMIIDDYRLFTKSLETIYIGLLYSPQSDALHVYVCVAEDHDNYAVALFNCQRSHEIIGNITDYFR